MNANFEKFHLAQRSFLSPKAAALFLVDAKLESEPFQQQEASEFLDEHDALRIDKLTKAYLSVEHNARDLEIASMNSSSLSGRHTSPEALREYTMLRVSGRVLQRVGLVLHRHVVGWSEESWMRALTHVLPASVRALLMLLSSFATLPTSFAFWYLYPQLLSSLSPLDVACYSFSLFPISSHSFLSFLSSLRALCVGTCADSTSCVSARACHTWRASSGMHSRAHTPSAPTCVL